MDDAPGVGKKKRKRRTEIKKIADKNARNVTFTKRRTGLFRRVDALSRRFRFDYFIVVFSPAGRAYSAGNPSLARSLLDARRSPAPNAASAAAGTPSSSAPAPALPSRDASDAADNEEKPQEIVRPQAAATSSSAHVELDGVDGEKARRLRIHALMKLRRRVADRIAFLTGLSVENGISFRHYV